MSIQIDDKSEFTISIADLIKELSKRDMFLLKIWVSGSDLCYTFNETHDLVFLEETLKVITNTRIHYLLYDTMVAISVIYDKEAIEWELL